MGIELLTNRYKRDPNQKIDSLYFGVAPGNRTVTRVVGVSKEWDRLEAIQSFGSGIPRGAGGRVAVLVLGGMETTLDEMEYILEAKQQKAFVPQRSSGQIVEMCRMVQERRNEQIKYLRKNPSERPRKRRVTLYLPTGYRFVKTDEPGLEVRVRG